MLFWALLASGQINMRKVDGWQTLATKPVDQPNPVSHFGEDGCPGPMPNRQVRRNHVEVGARQIRE
jgi:hypothetical protein